MSTKTSLEFASSFEGELIGKGNHIKGCKNQRVQTCNVDFASNF